MTAAETDEVPPVGLLLVNIGTPNSTSVADVRRYLAEFLNDPEVIDIPAVSRWLLLHGVILRTRPAQSASKYAQIWTNRGSPLLFHSEDLASALETQLGDRYRVRVGMRYGTPSLEDGLDALSMAGCRQVLIAPMYPQQAASSTGTAHKRCRELLTSRFPELEASFLPPFYSEPGFLNSVIEAAREERDKVQPDHILFSYHSLPERHIRKADPSGNHCLASSDCCDRIDDRNKNCYRAQCMETSRQLADRLELTDDQWSVSFQSRLGRTPWIQPTTSDLVNQQPPLGRRLLVLIPSFVADCLETLEEVNIGHREEFMESGGEAFGMAPCVNSHPAWVEAFSEMVTRHVELHFLT
jgi:ferrochelatase